jgi:hypothetical protein
MKKGNQHRGPTTMNDEDTDFICHECIGESFLKEEVKKRGSRITCSYCNRKIKGLSISDISKRIEDAFDAHYDFCSSDDEDFFNGHLMSSPVIEAIMDAAQISRPAAEDIQEILKNDHYDMDNAINGYENEFGPDSYYEFKQPNDTKWQKEWQDFERSLKTETRFFNDMGKQILNSIFEGIHELKSYDKRPLIVLAGPGKEINRLYRARVFQSDDHLKNALSSPDKQLGPPPPLVASAGRMNASGISVFYGANVPRLAIAEVRPPVGSQVLVGCFDLIQDLKLLDLTALSKATLAGSIFDDKYSERLEMVAFLRTLSNLITQPVMPNDATLDYLPTQAIADFLASDSIINLDGIIYTSTQLPGNDFNVILFNKASNVKTITHQEGTEIDVETQEYNEDGWSHNYKVWLRIPDVDFEKIKDKLSFTTPKEETRTPTLSLDLNSLQVHVVSRVLVDSQPHSVTHYKTNKIDYSELQDD